MSSSRCISIRWSRSRRRSRRASCSRELQAIEARDGRVRASGGRRARSTSTSSASTTKRSTSRPHVPHPELANRAFWQRELAELREVSDDTTATQRARARAADVGAGVREASRAHRPRDDAARASGRTSMRSPTTSGGRGCDAGLLHDALKDAPTNRSCARWSATSRDEPQMLARPGRGRAASSARRAPPCAARAVRYHTVGYLDWDRTGRALYMADFLEPGRSFARRDRAFLAAQVPHDFDGVFRQVAARATGVVAARGLLALSGDRRALERHPVKRRVASSSASSRRDQRAALGVMALRDRGEPAARRSAPRAARFARPTASAFAFRC